MAVAEKEDGRDIEVFSKILNDAGRENALTCKPLSIN